MKATAEFFDEMAPYYDRDVVDVGWDPIELIQGWPIVVPSGGHIIDAGCGTGAVLEYFGGAGRTHAGFDVSKEMIREAKKRPAVKRAELWVQSASEPWPVADESADLTIALAMLEFIEGYELEQVLQEMCRVTRFGGRVFFSVEDVTDWNGTPKAEKELRYGRFPLWRRSLEDVLLCMPDELHVVRKERVKGYTVLEEGFTCAYHVIEAERRYV